MKIILILPLIFSASLFGQKKQQLRYAVAININSIGDLPSSGLGNIHDGGKFLNGGDEKDKSLSLGINGNYFIKSDIAIRIKAVLANRKYQEYRDTRTIQSSNPANARIDNVSITESDISIAPGIYYQYKQKIFAIYTGFDVEFIHYGKTKLLDIVTNISQSPSANYVIENTTTIPSGNSFGPGGFIGFNLFPFKHISAGFEFSSAFLYTKIGNRVYLKTRVLSGNASNFDDSYQDSMQRFRFTEVKTSLNICYWF